jgi:hypothetical protein
MYSWSNRHRYFLPCFTVGDRISVLPDLPTGMIADFKVFGSGRPTVALVEEPFLGDGFPKPGPDFLRKSARQTMEDIYTDPSFLSRRLLPFDLGKQVLFPTPGAMPFG